MIRMNGVSFRYGDRWVLRDFSHRLPSTGTVALLGPSGCGKTTLLRVLAGLEPSRSGEIVLPPGARLSMVFQEDRLLPNLTARENLLAVLDRGQEDIAAYCLEQCALGPQADEYTGELSGGMRRRVAVARGVAYGGDILLLDEPLKGLDEALKGRVAEFLFRVDPAHPVHRPRLNLLVTHDIAEAAAYADEILLARGAPLEIADSVKGELEGLSAEQRLALCRSRWGAQFD